MNEIVNKFLIAGDEFMPEMHLRLTSKDLHIVLVFHSVKKDSRYIYQNELDKACFQYDMAYGDFKDLNRRTFADKVLHGKAFDIAEGSKYNRHQRGLASMVFRLFDKKTSGSGIKNGNISNKELAQELHKPIIRNFNKIKVH